MGGNDQQIKTPNLGGVTQRRMKTAEDIKAYIEYRDIQHKELRGGVMMYDVKDQHKWLTESELLQHWIDHIYTSSPTSLPSDWTSQCSCNPDDKTGETWCCNTCGKPTPRLSTELPSDEEKPDLQPLPEALPDFMLHYNRSKLSSLQLWEKIREHFGTQQSNLQALPRKMPEWFAAYFNGRGNDAATCWSHIINVWGIHPIPWWVNLKKGDKVLYRYTTGYSIIFEWHGIAEMRGDGEWYLWDHTPTLHNVKYCSPYTPSPLDQLLSTFTPEQKAIWEKVKEGKDE